MKISTCEFYKKFIIFITIVGSLCYEIHIFKYYSILQIIISLLLIMLLMLYAKYEKNSILKKMIIKQPLLFILFYLRIINTILGMIFFGFNGYTDIISIIIMAFTTCTLFYVIPEILAKNKDTEKSFLKCYIYICIILSIFSIFIKVGNGHFLFWNYVYVIRDASIYYDSNFLAVVLGIGLLLSIMYKFKNRFIKYISLFLMFSAIYFTGSRGTLISLICAIFLYLIIYSNLKFHRKIILISIFTIICFYGINYLYENDFFRLYQGSNNRFEMWIDGLILSFKSPLFGYGYGSVDTILKNMNYINASTHNSFIDFLLIYGFPCLFIYLYYIIKILLKSISIKTNRIYVLTMIFMLINANTILYSFGGVGLSSMMFTVVLGILNYSLFFSNE